MNTGALHSLYLRHFRKVLARECPDLTVRVELCVGDLFRTQHVFVEVWDCTYIPFTENTMWGRQRHLFESESANYPWRNLRNNAMHPWFTKRFRKTLYAAHAHLTQTAQDLEHRFGVGLGHEVIKLHYRIPDARLNEYSEEFRRRFDEQGVKIS